MPVHEGENPFELMRRAGVEPSRSLATVAPWVPRAIVEVVDCALAFEKEDRWQSAREMRAALWAAYRLHFGRSPSLTPLAVSADAPASHVTPVRARIARAALGAEPEPARMTAAPASIRADGGTLVSRTSMPCAADRTVASVPPARARPFSSRWEGSRRSGSRHGWRSARSRRLGHAAAHAGPRDLAEGDAPRLAYSTLEAETGVMAPAGTGGDFGRRTRRGGGVGRDDR